MFMSFAMWALILGHPGLEMEKQEMWEIVKTHGAVFDKALKAQDLDMVVGIYSDSAKYLAEGGGIFQGKAEIREAWSQALPFLSAMELNPVTVDGSRQLIYETGLGRTQIKQSGGETTWISFKYVNIWQLQADGTYRLDVDIYKPIQP